MMRPELPQRGMDALAVFVSVDGLGELRQRFRAWVAPTAGARLGRDCEESAKQFKNPRGALPLGKRLKPQQIVNRKRNRLTSTLPRCLTSYLEDTGITEIGNRGAILPRLAQMVEDSAMPIPQRRREP
jgi:hypothetical protein